MPARLTALCMQVHEHAFLGRHPTHLHEHAYLKKCVDNAQQIKLREHKEVTWNAIWEEKNITET